MTNEQPVERTTRTDVLRHNVGTCPSCREYLWAAVTVVSAIRAPTISAEGKPHTFASAEVTAMSVKHVCNRYDDPAPDDPQPASDQEAGAGA